MAIRRRKPTSPGRRFQTQADFSELTRTSPEKSLTSSKPKTGGRNNYGRKTSRHRGGGHKQLYRQIDFRRDKTGVPATVASIEYDPNRTCRIALLHYHDGEKRYILAPNTLSVGEILQSGQGSEIRVGNALPLRYIPVGTVVHNIELRPGGGGKLARSRNRWKGKRPQTRGVAMNPVDHPHGGGEGKTSGGRHPVSPWGKPESRTRSKKKQSQKLIVRRRRTRGSRR